MTVKDKVGRPRYVAFRMSGHAHRSALANAIERAAAQTARPGQASAFRLTLIENGVGFLRVPHTLKDAAIAALAHVRDPVTLTPLGTSGTLRAAKRKYLPAPDTPR